MHDPIGLLSVRCAAFVEHERLALADQLLQLCLVNGFVAPSCLPESGSRRTVGSVPSWILPVLVTEEVPIRLFRAPAA